MTLGGTKLSVLIIGCGAIAGGYDQEDLAGPNVQTHAKAFLNHDGFELSACVDINIENAQKFAKKWGVKKSYRSLDEAYMDNSFDVISICTNTASHEEYLRHLKGRDFKVIICEKPLTDNINTACDVAALFPEKLAVNYIRRFLPEIRQLASDIHSGKFGKLKSVTGHYNKGLFNNGSHMTDLLLWFFGPLDVITAHDVIYDFWAEDPTISARLKTRDDAPVKMIGTDVRQGMIFDVVMSFERAEVKLTDFCDTLSITPQKELTKSLKTDLHRVMYYVVSNIYDHVTSGDDFYSTGKNAVLALEVCDQIRKRAAL